MATGREIYGFPKEMGWFLEPQIPKRIRQAISEFEQLPLVFRPEQARRQPGIGEQPEALSPCSFSPSHRMQKASDPSPLLTGSTIVITAAGMQMKHRKSQVKRLRGERDELRRAQSTSENGDESS